MALLHPELERSNGPLVCMQMASALHDQLREHWYELKSAQPGRRFQQRYHRARRDEKKSGPGQRIVLFVLAGISLAIGAVLTVMPGPAVLFFFIAGGLLATESRTIARFMDWSEVRVRNLLAWAKRRWRRLPTGIRVVVVVLAAGCSVAGVYLSFRLIHG